MKNISLVILGVFLGALLMYLYNNRDNQLPVESPITKPGGLISPQEARDLDTAYNIKYRIISDSLFKNSTTGDNRSSWFSLEEIEDYIVYAKKQANELNYTMDGLRLYLGSYPDINDDTGLTTIFLVPTGFINTSRGSMHFMQQTSRDIPGGDGLNFGGSGYPPGANYPQ